MDDATTQHRTRTPRWRTLLVGALGAIALLVPGAFAASASASTVWLCKPGQAGDPCTSDLTTTVQTGSGASFVEKGHAASNPPIDCFYVYPTVSEQTTGNANLAIEPVETQVAVDQASRFSKVCKVYAPMYPQVTIPTELAEVPTGAFNPAYVATAYAGVEAAWREYLAKYNHGRGVVLIGHSQGAGMLRLLMKKEIDPNRAQRRLLVSAYLMGGNVSVPEGKLVGGDFQNIPACQTAVATGCVVAYSTFLNEPPDDTLFGVVEGPVSTLGGGPATGKNLQVLCVNPALLIQGARSGPLLPYESTTPFPGAFLGLFWQTPSASTAWVSTPGQYTAKCQHSGAHTWLQVTNVGPSGDPRVQLAETLGPTFGLHLYDVNIALGNLVGLAGLQSLAYQISH
jgi:hypothetical protein